MTNDHPAHGYIGPWFNIGLLFVLVFSAYSNTFQATWHLDDYPNIVRNAQLHIRSIDFSSLLKTFFAHPESSRVLYRPISCLTFALNWYWGKDNVVGYHVVNLFIHFSTASILFLTILNLLKSPNLKNKFKNIQYPIAFLSAAFWMLNPIQTQAVTYIVQRMSSLSGMFYILGIYFYIKWKCSDFQRNRTLFFLGVFMSFALSLGSKENSVTFPIALFLIEFTFFKKPNQLNDSKVFSRAVLAIALSILITVTLAFLFMDKNPIAYIDSLYEKRPFSLLERVMTQPRVILLYLSLIFIPLPNRLSIVHDVVISRSLFEPWTTFVSIVVILFLIGFGLTQLKKRPILGFGLLFFFLNHLVESTILPLEMVFEHRNYLPTMFLFFPISTAIVMAVNYYREKKHLIYLMEISFISILIISLCGMTYLRNMVWTTEKTLWEDALVKAPKNAKPLQNMAAYYKSIGQMDKALELYELSLSSYQERANQSKSLSFNNMGNIYLSKGENEKAIRYYYKALHIYPDQQRARFNLVLALIKMGKWEAALKHIDLILPTYYNHYNCLNLKGYVLLKQKKPKAAMLYFTSALQIAPDDRNVNLNAGIALGRMGNYQQGERYLKRADQVSSNDMIVLLCIVENRLNAGDKLSAVKYLANLRRLFSDDTIVTFVKNISKDKSAIPLSSDLLIQFIQDQNG